ncbi:nucleotidyl transferase AbiEii/AbiGii toxin family protein [Candidatus Shapirobacteria bacterium]|nr:nucleotidyl transferase AbiEii/AbiGii toxin family protein [Candidatus Shapirobacteria bacterium]
MIERKILADLATKKETTFFNIGREYLQNLFLAKFYQKTGSENFLFKGGTALRLVFGSPRFSEDLDFTGLKNGASFEKILEDVLVELSLENLKVELTEAKPTSGGYFSLLAFDLFGEKIEIEEEVSFRPAAILERETALVAWELSPAYKVYLLGRRVLVAEKAKALIMRQKPRDIFDLYFILRNEQLRRELKLTEEEREAIFSLLLKKDKREIDRELRTLLPKSFWPIIKDLPAVLKMELGRS